ncbi:olfactory receptor 11H6-like [Tachyglossus aculeatus]|uniref:olfactory receptor 11H6-like n=1 Tax=Tachyglossus aculeatus TaxID=9261 RepID=UPI0018F58E65|nr:olfactory receptor 11H6-like [Tachyglossus aculeatus]
MALPGSSNFTGSRNGFVLLGFPCRREIRPLLFSFFSVSFALTLLGNGAIVCTVRRDRRLHTPMYLLLGSFSFVEICYVTSTVPNLMVNILSDTKAISLAGCFLQFYCFFSLGTTECLHLSVMAFDRFLAICQPLRYPSIMTNRSCAHLVISCWAGGFLWFLLPVYLVAQLPFCGPNVIDHILCDSGPLLALSCTPAPGLEFTCSGLSFLLLLGSLLFILGSYALVLRAVLRVPSAAGRHKAFSTCGSHLAVVALFYGSVMGTYVSPGAGGSGGGQKVVTLFYSVLTPLCNPLIYSLRNQEMKAALRSGLGWAGPHPGLLDLGHINYELPTQPHPGLLDLGQINYELPVQPHHPPTASA